jgi:hypothetical protein
MMLSAVSWALLYVFLGIHSKFVFVVFGVCYGLETRIRLRLLFRY